MRIGIVCYPSVGGSGIVASQLGCALAKAGHIVHFICSKRPVRLDEDTPNLHFHPVELGEYAVFQGTDYSLPLAVKIAEVSRNERLDLLHVHYAIPHAVAAILAIDMLGAGAPRLVTTLHGTDITLLGKDPAYRELLSYAMRRSDAITTVSHSLREDTLQLFPDCGKIQVVHNFCYYRPPTRSRYDVRDELGVGEDDLLVLHMSNLRPGKRMDLILETIARSAYKDRLYLAVLAGDDFTPYLEDVQRLGLEGRVIVRRSTEVENYVEACDIGLYASERESFGLAILETMLGSRPVVVTDVGGVGEVVGPDGFLAHNLQGLVRNLDQLCASPQLRAAAGEAGRRRALETFSLERAMAGYLEVYATALQH